MGQADGTDGTWLSSDNTGFTVNSPHCQFAPVTNSLHLNIGQVGFGRHKTPHCTHRTHRTEI